MPEARLAAGLWVDAYRQRLQIEGIPVYVARRGDATAGAIIVKLATLDGKAVAFHRVPDLLTGGRDWAELTKGPEAEVDLAINRQAAFDPDLWVIEVEDRQGRHCLDEPGLD